LVKDTNACPVPRVSPHSPLSGTRACSRAGSRRRPGTNDVPFKAFLLCLMAATGFIFTGCTQLILRAAAPSLMPGFTASIFEECDTSLAEKAIPSSLKLMEGLLRNDPGNKEILVSLSMGFAGYSLLFVEPEDPERASRLYLRAFDYGLRALGDKGRILRDQGLQGQKLEVLLKTMDKDDYEALFWTTLSWNAWISLNLDQPKALSQIAAAEACLRRLLEMDPRYLHALPHILMGVSLSARPPLLGGNPEKARAHFEAALEENNGKFFLTQVYFARYYAVRVQDKVLFERLLRDVTTGDPNALKDVCLINQVMKQRAEFFRKTMDDLFF
jgi:tetratricopeptide (TPR) repeat protein